MGTSLYELSTRIRKILLGVAVFVLIVIAVDTLLRFLNSPLSPFFSTGSYYLEANNAWGEVPVPNIPTQAIDDNSTPAYLIETAQLPVYPDTAFVYRIEEPREKLNTIESARGTAASLGFGGNFSEDGEGIISWDNAEGSKKLTFDRNLQVWRMRTQYFVSADAARPKKVETNLDYYSGRANSITTGLGFGHTSLTSGFAVAKFAKLGVNGLFTSPISAASADYVAIDVFRKFALAQLRQGISSQVLQSARAPKDFEGKVYKNDPRVGSFHAIVSDKVSDLAKDVYEFDFVDYEFSNGAGIYKVVSPAEGWERIRQGKGALMLVSPQGADYFAPSQVLPVSRFVADATKVEIGYWEPPITDKNRFLYPIYIFRGRVEFSDNRPAGEFTFFVDALQRNI